MKTMLKIITVLALLLVGVSSTFAQGVFLPPIDGSVHPEQIPQQVILFLWLQQYTSEGYSHVPLEAGLNATDSKALASIMDDFKAKNDVLMQMFSQMPDSESHWADHYALVAAEWSAIEAQLSPAGVANFSAYLEREKAGAKVSAYDYGLGTVAKRNRAEAGMVASKSPQKNNTITPNYSELISMNMTAPGGISSDPFLTTGPPSSSWTQEYGSFSVTSSGLTVTGGGGASGQDSLMYSNGTFSNDQCYVVTVGTVPSATGEIGPAVRISPNSETFYVAWMVYGNTLAIVKFVNANATWLNTATYNPSSGDTISLCAKGTALTAQVLNSVNAGLTLTASDSDISSGHPGIEAAGTGSRGTLIMGVGNGTVNVQIMDQVSGNSICASACPNTPRHYSATNTNGTLGGTNVFAVTEADFCGTSNENVSYPTLMEDDSQINVTINNQVWANTISLVVWAATNAEFWEQRELGMAMWRNTASPTGTSYVQYCSARTSIGDLDLGFAPIAGDSLEPALAVSGVAERIGGGASGWKLPWFYVGEGNTLSVLPQKPVDCTNWDNGWINQIKGGRILTDTGGPQPANPPVQ